MFEREADLFYQEIGETLGDAGISPCYNGGGHGLRWLYLRIVWCGYFSSILLSEKSAGGLSSSRNPGLFSFHSVIRLSFIGLQIHARMT
jgi:hypothetical protein